MVVNGINVTISGINDMSEQEVVAYIDMLQDENQDELSQLTISPAENGEVNLDYVLQPARFERIRRITGYLVGTIDRWNNAKRAEEHDRVKHGLNQGKQGSRGACLHQAAKCARRQAADCRDGERLHR